MNEKIAKWSIRAGVIVATAGALVLLFLSFADSRRWLVIGAVALVIPAVVYLVASATRMKRWSLGSLAFLIAALVIGVTVASVGGYRAFVWTTCMERVGPGADLRGCNLSGRTLQNADLSNADLSKADLHDADLSDADMSGAKLGDTVLERATLTGANLDRADLSAANLSGASLSGASLRGATGSNAYLSFTTLTNADLTNADLTNADLTNADLTSANLEGAKAGGANPSSAKAADTDFSYANLTGTDLTGASLLQANLTEADFTGAKLHSVDLEGATLVGAVGLSDAILSDGLSVSRRSLARELSNKGLFLDTKAQITASVGAACRGRSVPGAGTSRSSGTFVVVMNGNGRYRAKGLAVGLQPTGIRFVELVVCVGPVTDSTVETCPYTVRSTGSTVYKKRYLQKRLVRLVRPRNGRVIAEQTVQSGTPAACPAHTQESDPGAGGYLAPIGTTLYDGSVRRTIASMIAAHPVP
jgi:uncharacterized protein YjbI with pentapeptide repeats